jgi:hypothetical protein
MPPRKSNPPASDAEDPSPEGTVSAAATTPAVVEEADNASPPSPIPEKIYKEPKPPKPRDDDTLSVEDLNLPKSIVQRLAKGVLPPNTQIQKDALLAMSKGATVFVNYLTSQYVTLHSPSTPSATELTSYAEPQKKHSTAGANPSCRKTSSPR